MAIVEIKDPREVAMKIENDREKQFRSVFYGIEDQFIALNTGEEGLGMTLRSLAWVTGQRVIPPTRTENTGGEAGLGGVNEFILEFIAFKLPVK